MTHWDDGLLGDEQSAWVARRLDAPALVEDLSWGLVDTKVLRVRAGGRDYVVKAAGRGNHHIGREITAHEAFTEPLVRLGRTGALVAADRVLNVLLVVYQPGVLVEGTPHEFALDVHAQAGEVLRAFHGQHRSADDEYERRATDKAISWLDREHRIERRIEHEARRILGAYRPAPVAVVPTHGDWQPRNWLIDTGRLRVIDFGRFELRPPASDLGRLATQQWRETPALEEAFLGGYGADPRDPEVWSMALLREAIGTAAWAFQVGDAEFEAQGHRMLHDALARF